MNADSQPSQPVASSEPRAAVNASATSDTSGHAVPSAPLDSLGVAADAIARSGETLELASRHLDPSLVDVLRHPRLRHAITCRRGGPTSTTPPVAATSTSTRGEGFASLGHNHPDVRDALRATLAADLVDGVQIHYSPLAGMLAQELSQRLPSGLDAVFFASTGAEAVDSAMKFARAATGRPRLISCDSCFHGVTLGPLSLVGDDFFKEGFGPLLPGCERVPFGDLARLEAQLRDKGRGGLHRRADPGAHGDVGTGGLPAGRTGAVQALRDDVRRRRDPDRARAHRALVRARALGTGA